ncbi:putative chromatin regulator PHD family [Helianthus anomalus]
MLATPSSDATAMAWNWVIQSIAKFKQVDTSTLAGLVDQAPEISVDMGKDAKEMVSLQILESLFQHGNEADSAQNAKIPFDSSEHCEDILHKILEETSQPMTELDRRKWNIRPFITHKRASLPKTPVQKFKEALVEGSHPILESLKEMSKTIPEVDVAQTKDDLVFLKTENENSKLQESPSQHVEDSNRGIGRKEDEMIIEPPEENTLMDHVEDSNIEPPEENTLMDHAEDSSRRGIPGGGIERNEDEMSIKPQVKDFEENTLVDHDNIDHGQQQPPSEDDDEMTDIAAKKEAFLSSQCTLSQDFTETFVCMKCSKGGQLLVCCSDACPFRVHESCLGSASTFDGNENFFCPFCSYSHAISKYMEVKKKASLARKDLQAFLSSGGVSLNENIFKSNGNEHAMRKDKDCGTAESLHQSTPQAGKEKESLVSSTSSHSKRARKQEPHYTSTTVTLPRRRNLFWEKAEEEMLKDGMLRFSCEDNKRIPWKKILDFGRQVFDKTRTTIDLKDKWRNICKESPAVKKQKL